VPERRLFVNSLLDKSGRQSAGSNQGRNPSIAWPLYRKPSAYRPKLNLDELSSKVSTRAHCQLQDSHKVLYLELRNLSIWNEMRQFDFKDLHIDILGN
jgi:hypothetical protein